MFDIIKCINQASLTPQAIDTDEWQTSAAVFWWLLVHLESLVCAPTPEHVRDASIQETMKERITQIRCGNIQSVYEEAMRITSWTSGDDRPDRNENKAAQEAANCDNWRSAKARAVSPNLVAPMGDDNIETIEALYSKPHPPLDLPPRPPPSQQQYFLPGNVAKTIRKAAKRKGKGSNGDSLDAFIGLAKQNRPEIDKALQEVFNLVFQGRLPAAAKQYFTDTYLFCLYKDPSNPSKLRPLGIPSAVRRIVASHVAKYYRGKFAHHLLPYNFAIGVDRGMDFAIKQTQLQVDRYIQQAQARGEVPTRVGVFLDLRNMFNLVSREKLLSVIADKFPELLPLAETFYADKGKVNLKYADGTWHRIMMEEGFNQGCPLSAIFAAIVLNEVLSELDRLLTERAEERLRLGDKGDDGYGSRTHLSGYVDDVGAVVPVVDVKFFLETFDKLAQRFGCFLNVCKTRILTSCTGQSILPQLRRVDSSVADELADTIATFSVKPSLTPGAFDPVEVTDGFVYLGCPIGSSDFARKYFKEKVDEVRQEARKLHQHIADHQTRLRLFTMSTMQKLPYLLGMDIMHNLPLFDFDYDNWMNWYGELVEDIEELLRSFLSELLDGAEIPDHSLLICQLGIKQGGLGLIHPASRAVSDFMVGMNKARFTALHGFKIWKDSVPIKPHPSITKLFDIQQNQHSTYLQRFHNLLPHVAPIACPTACAPSEHVTHFLDHVSPSSATSRLRSACSITLREHFYRVIADTLPDQLGTLSSLLSPHMSYPLIAMNRSDPRNRLTNDIFDISLRRKLLLPIYTQPPEARICTCSATHDALGHHVFNCIKNNKKMAHDFIRDGLSKLLPKILATAEYILPSTTELPTEQTDVAPSFPDKKPFDVSFEPTPLPDSMTAPHCPFRTVGLDVVIPSTPHLSSPHDSLDVIEKVSANAEVHHQSYERQKLRRDGDKSEGDTIIGELLTGGHVLLPFAVDGYGGLGPMARQFLYGERPRQPLTFRRDRPNATRMYARAMTPPAPHGIVTIASIRWKQNRTRAFYGHSYTAPTPHEYLLQQMGLCFTKAFALHIRNSYRKLERRRTTGNLHSHSHNHAPAAADPS